MSPTHPSQLRWERLSNSRHAASVQSAGLQGEGLAPCSQTPAASMERADRAAAKARVKLFGTPVPLTAGKPCQRLSGGTYSKAKAVLFQLERVQFQKEPFSSL